MSQLKKMSAPYQRDSVDLCLAGNETTVHRLLSELHNWRFEKLKRGCEATVHEAMEWWACFRPEEPSYNSPFDFQRRVKSKSKKQKVGRNDPCPSGSGKKYKKRCLV
jgi:uncharacterized protein YecA (UPF0149 family)